MLGKTLKEADLEQAVVIQTSSGVYPLEEQSKHRRGASTVQ